MKINPIDGFVGIIIILALIFGVHSCIKTRNGPPPKPVTQYEIIKKCPNCGRNTKYDFNLGELIPEPLTRKCEQCGCLVTWEKKKPTKKQVQEQTETEELNLELLKLQVKELKCKIGTLE